MNNLTISGNIGRDAEVRTTQTGKQLCSFTVAVSGRRKDDLPTWFDCSIWGDRASKVAPYIRKGDKISLCGEVLAREHDGKAYLQVNVREFTFMGGSQRDQPAQPSQGGYGGGEMSDEIPFMWEGRA